MGRFLAVNGALLVLVALFFLTLIVTAGVRCSRCLLHGTQRLISGFAWKRVGLGAAGGKGLENSPIKSVLLVDQEPSALKILEAELRHAYPDLRLQRAATYREATMLMISWTYDLVIFDGTGGRGFDLLIQARNRPYPIPAVMLNADALPPAALGRARALGALLCPSREIVPFLDGMVKGKQEAVWRRMLHPVRRRASFPVRFTHGGYSGAATG